MVEKPDFCPICKSDNIVALGYTIYLKKWGGQRRRFHCNNCGHNFYGLKNEVKKNDKRRKKETK